MSVGRPHGLLLTQENEGSCSWLQVTLKHIKTTDIIGPYAGDRELPGMVRHASWLPAVRAGEWTDAQTGVHSNLRGGEGVNVYLEPDVSRCLLAVRIALHYVEVIEKIFRLNATTSMLASMTPAQRPAE